MHPESYGFVQAAVAALPPRRSVVELGARDVNGSVRSLFVDAVTYTGIDLFPGPGVDVVADAALWQPRAPVDTVVSASMLEHTPDGERIIANAYRMLVPGGVLILHANCDPWPPHSSIDGGAVRAGEYYGNVDPYALRRWLEASGFRTIVLATDPKGDVYVTAWRPLQEEVAA